MCRPAGAMRQPLGRSVVPPPWAAGLSAATAGRARRRTAAAWRRDPVLGMGFLLCFARDEEASMHRRLAVVLLILMSAPAGQSSERPTGRSFATRSVVYARHGMVAAAHPLAVQIGVDVLKKGGSAV